MTLFVLFLIVVIGLFVLGWFLIPKGKLTKIVSVIGTAIAGIYESVSEQFHILQQLIPPEAAPWLLGGFFAMIVIAAVRPGKD